MKDAVTLNEFRNAKTGEHWEPMAYVNATPDENYPLRILEAHLRNAEEGFWVANPPSAFADMMNRLQAERAVILRRAIVDLRSRSGIEVPEWLFKHNRNPENH